MNNVTLLGRITKDIVLRKTTAGTSVASFTLAVNRRNVKDNEQSADFINCVAWKQAAEYLAQYAKKGSQIALNGSIQSRSYDDASGKRVYVIEVVTKEVQLLDSKKPQEEKQSDEEFMAGPTLDVTSDDLPF